MNFNNRNKRRKKQLDKACLMQGYDRSSCWEIPYNTAKYLLPRLKHLRKYHMGYPYGLTNEIYESKLDAMIEGFEYYVKDSALLTDDEKERLDIIHKQEKAVKLFAELFFDLWD